MNHEWEYRSLDELCDFKNGLWKGKKPPYLHVGVIRNTNFTKDGRLDDSNIAYIDVEEKQYSSRKLKFGDLLLEKSGGGPKQPVGRVVPFEKEEGEFSFSNFTSIIRIKDAHKLNYSFLHRFLHHLYLCGATESMQKHSTNIRNLQLKEYKKIQVPLPPLDEQKRIVAILDEALAGIDKAIANTENNLTNARELFSSYLTEIFDYAITEAVELPLQKYTRFIDYRGKTPRKTESGVRLITAKNVRMGVLRREPEEFVGKQDYDQWMTRGIPIKGDVLFTTEAPLGFVCQLDTDEKVVFAQRVIVLQPERDTVDPAYLKYALISSPLQQRIHSKATGATAVGIKASLLKKVEIPVPPISTQRKVALILEDFEERCDRLESIYQDKLALLLELKQSLLHRAFSGELTGNIGNNVDEAVA